MIYTFSNNLGTNSGTGQITIWDILKGRMALSLSIQVFSKRYINGGSRMIFLRSTDTLLLVLENGIGFASAGKIERNKMQIGIAEAYGIQKTITYNKTEERFLVPFKMNNVRIYLTNISKGLISYRIKGLSEEWIHIKATDHFLLASLPSGNYSVEIRDDDKAAPSTYFTLEITVSRPWCFSNSAILYYLLIICCIAWLTRRY